MLLFFGVEVICIHIRPICMFHQGQLYYLVLRTKISILKADKMSPLFLEVIVASSVAQFKKMVTKWKIWILSFH